MVVKSLSSRIQLGFTVLELLCVIAVIGVICAMAVPTVARVRKSAWLTAELNSASQVAGAVVTYAGDSKDIIPTLMPRPQGWPERRQEVIVDGVTYSVHWFGNSGLYYRLLDPYLPASCIGIQKPYDPGFQGTKRGLVPRQSRFHLSETYFAASNYWTPEGQSPALWGSQSLASVAFPSAKGMVWSFPVAETRRVDNIPVPVFADPGHLNIAWNDLSASREEWMALRQGIENRYRSGKEPGILSAYASGPAVSNTVWGVSGVDR